MHKLSLLISLLGRNLNRIGILSIGHIKWKHSQWTIKTYTKHLKCIYFFFLKESNAANVAWDRIRYGTNNTPSFLPSVVTIQCKNGMLLEIHLREKMALLENKCLAIPINTAIVILIIKMIAFLFPLLVLFYLNHLCLVLCFFSQTQNLLTLFKGNRVEHTNRSFFSFLQKGLHFSTILFLR